MCPPDVDDRRRGLASCSEETETEGTRTTPLRGPIGGDLMGKDKNDELRDERNEQEEHRQHLRDRAFEEGDGAIDDAGSQDERRKEGLDRY